MEVWILLAAAGSGYLARRWQNAQKPRDSCHGCDEEEEGKEVRNDAAPSARLPPPTRGRYRRFSSSNAKRDGKLFGRRSGPKAPGSTTDAKCRDKGDCGDAGSLKNGRDGCGGKGPGGYGGRDTEDSRDLPAGTRKVEVSRQQGSGDCEGEHAAGYGKDHGIPRKSDVFFDPSDFETRSCILSTVDRNNICGSSRNDEDNERTDIEAGVLSCSSSGDVACDSTSFSSSRKSRLGKCGNDENGSEKDPENGYLTQDGLFSISGKRANDSEVEIARKSGHLIQDGLSGKRIKDSMHQRPSQSEGSVFSTWMPGFWDVSEGIFVLDTESLLVQETEKKSKGTSSRKSRTPSKISGRSKCSRKKLLAPQRPMSSLESCLSAQLDRDVKRERMHDKEISGLPSGRVIPSQLSYSVKAYDDLKPGRLCGEFVSGLPSLTRRVGLNNQTRESGTRNTGSMRVRGGDECERKKEKDLVEREWETFLNEHPEELAHVSMEGMVYNFGVGVGMMFTIMSNKHEVRKLTSLLEEAESIIKSLEKELKGRCGSGNHSMSQEGDHVQRESLMCSTLLKVRSATSSLHDMGKVLNDSEQVPDMSRLQLDDITALEAELEAELERMDMSLGNGEKDADENSFGVSECNLEVGNLVKGELRTMGLPYELEEDEVNEGQSESSPEEFYNGNYAVSPRELEKRLHEVLASQQEQLISELEAQLKSMEIKLQEKEAELQSLKIGSLSPFKDRNSRFDESCEGSRSFLQSKKNPKIKELPKRSSRNPFCSGSRNASPASPSLACATTAVSLKNSSITGESAQISNAFIGLGDEALAAYGRESCDEFSGDIGRDPANMGAAPAKVPDYKEVPIKAESRTNRYINLVQSDVDNVEHVDLLSLAEDFSAGYEPGVIESMSSMSSKGRKHHPRRRNSRASQHPEPEQFLATSRGIDSSDDMTNDTSVSTPCSVKWIDTRTTGAFFKEEGYEPLPESFGLNASREADFYLDGLHSPDRDELPFECDDCSAPEDYSSELDEPLGKLIKRIVEKSRKGSPIVQEAQIVLASFESMTD